MKRFVLDELPNHDPDVAGLTPLEQRFSQLLRDFSMKGHKGEPPGAAFQGIVYGYIRADAPHLHLDISKVGAGSKRLQRVGDIDGWEGERLVLSAEVKNYSISAADVGQFTEFANEVARREAMGLLAAHSFADVAAVDLEGMGLRAVDRESLIRLVDLWDPLKQRAALNAFVYYAHHVEKNSVLIRRVGEFLAKL